MKRVMLAVAMLLSVAVLGCGSRWGSAGLGAVGGAAAGAGAYEYNTQRQLDKLEEDYKAGRIDKREYDIRRDQIKRGSVIE